MSITVKNLNFSYGDHEVLKGITFELKENEFVAVLGPNGVGKTTLFRCLLSLEKSYTGSVELDGVSVKGISAKELAHRIAYIPQIHKANFAFSVLDMVLMGTSHRIGAFSNPGKKEVKIALDSLDDIGIGNLAEKKYSQISGGEQQMVLIARALAQGAKTLIMDEPTASLDYKNGLNILSLMRRLSNSGFSVILSTHNPQHALWYADKAIAISDGEIIGYGAPQTLITEELLKSLYDIKANIVNTEMGGVIYPLIGDMQK